MISPCPKFGFKKRPKPKMKEVHPEPFCHLENLSCETTIAKPRERWMEEGTRGILQAPVKRTCKSLAKIHCLCLFYMVVKWSTSPSISWATERVKAYFWLYLIGFLLSLRRGAHSSDKGGCRFIPRWGALIGTAALRWLFMTETFSSPSMKSYWELFKTLTQAHLDSFP